MNEKQLDGLATQMAHEYVAENHRFLGTQFTEEQFASHLEWRKAMLKQDDRLSVFEDRPAGVFFASAKKLKQDWGEEIVRIGPCEFESNDSNHRRLLDFANEASAKWPGVAVEMALMTKNFASEDFFRRHGFLPSNNALVGKISDSLEHLRPQSLPQTLSFRAMELEDSELVINFDKAVHAAEPTSRGGYTSTETGRARLREYHIEICNDKTGFLLFEETKLVGTVSLFLTSKEPKVNQTFMDLPLIAGISVHPEHWGKGLSKILYAKVLRLAQEKGFTYYTGNTTTTKVLKLAEKMKRHTFQKLVRRNEGATVSTTK